MRDHTGSIKMIPPTLLARSNSARADALVRWLGWRNSEDDERQDNFLGVLTAYQYSHIVVGIKGAAPKTLSAVGLSIVRDGTRATYFGGTLARWREVIDVLPESQERVRTGLVAAIAHHTSLVPFGAARYFPKTDSVFIPTDTATMRGAAAPIFGGIVVLSADRHVVAELQQHGATLLALPPHKDPLSLCDLVAEVAPPKDVPEPYTSSAVTRIGTLLFPIEPSSISEADRILLERFEAGYRQVVPKLKNAALADLIRLPFEAIDVLLVVDGIVLDTCVNNSYAPVRETATTLRAVLAGVEGGVLGPRTPATPSTS